MDKSIEDLEVCFSIIMPFFNTEKYIEEAILSVLNQSFDKWELICIDDCSSDS